jgi:hypothetical protein
MTKQRPQSQIEKFKKAARELGASESEVSFNRKLKKIAKTKPVERPKKKRPSN